MVFQLIDRKIRKAFSDAAIQYDVLTSMHKEIGRELLHKIIDTEKNERILDVGMGTGWLTKRVSFYFPESLIVGLDVAEGMVDIANEKKEGFHIIHAHAAHLPFQEGSFDIILSNLALQWIVDLKTVFQGCHISLKEGGRFHFTLFGYNTLNELFDCLQRVWQEKKSGQALSVRRLPTMAEVDLYLQETGWRNIRVDYERIKVHFPSMMDLLKWIKAIGANSLSAQTYLGKDFFKRTNDLYNSSFRDRLGICATFEVIWAEAEK